MIAATPPGTAAPTRRTRVASLPWYDLEEVRWATDELWCRLAERLRRYGFRGVPPILERRMPYLEQWSSGRLLLSQACGYDVLLAYPQHLRLLATPRYAAEGCEGPYYRSLVVVRDDIRCREIRELRGGRCVINSETSQSGMNVLRALVAPLAEGGRFFAEVEISGSHEGSLERIRRGDADVAAIDCVTWALLGRHRPGSLDGLRVLGRTPAALAPPFVTSAALPLRNLGRLRAALADTLADPALGEVRRALLLDGVDVLPLSSYRPIAAFEKWARDHGYEEIPGGRKMAGRLRSGAPSDDRGTPGKPRRAAIACAGGGGL